MYIMKKVNFLLFWLFVHFCSINAQSILDSIQIETPQFLVMSKKGKVNIRTAPSTKAMKYDVPPETPNFWQYGVIGEVDGFYKILCVSDTCYVSKSVTRKSETKPILKEMTNSRVCGLLGNSYVLDGKTYLYDPSWRVGVQNDLHKFAIAELDRNKLYLGKMVGDIFIFKYSAEVEISYDPAVRISARKETRQYSKNPVNIIYFGDDYYVECTDGTWRLDLTKIPNKLLEYVFGDSIRKNKVDWWCIGSELLTGKYTEYLPIECE